MADRKTHRLAVHGDLTGGLWLLCDAGDVEQYLGQTATPDEIARAADEHWRTPIGGA